MAVAVIETVRGDLFQADVDAYVNTVNTVGVMGKGIALQFKRRFPENFSAYERACKAGDVRIGRMFVFERGELVRPRFIINFPTKKHWRSRSRIEFIQEGLTDLVKQIERLDIHSIAVPALGCNNGGLEWSDVRPLIEGSLERFEHLEVYLYAPRTDEDPIEIKKTQKAPGLTARAALLLKAFELYSAAGYELGRTVVQKLAYFIQAAGKDMNTTFVKHLYGPYSEGITHFVEHFEGHYTEGFGDRSRPSRMILLPGVIEGVDAVLAEDASDEDRAVIKRMAALIEGFETPYAMELLASLHWANREDGILDVEAAKEHLASWNPQKAAKYQDHHIEIAWNHLQEQGWLST